MIQNQLLKGSQESARRRGGVDERTGAQNWIRLTSDASWLTRASALDGASELDVTVKQVRMPYRHLEGDVMANQPQQAVPSPLVPPTETPPVEGCTAEAHQERADGGLWEHPYMWLGLIVLGSIAIAGYFIARMVDL
ncbi:hypothetical protein ACICHK_42310 (plasmid) [Streptomyces sp. AHU1]|uniref:hypothetical protein n=1 Tax=Streptomyces sp. AHU1 TaxID=3377215 RepID=UPI0038782427